MDDYLGKAANEKQAAKTAIKEKRFDDAWRHLSNQKILYLKHAQRMRFSIIHRLVIESSPHEDMANILRLEGKHKNALSNISYTYKTNYSAKRPIITLEKKLEAYYNRAYKKQPFKRFLSLLKALPNSDFVSVRDFVEKFFPLAPDLVCGEAHLNIGDPNRELRKKESQQHVDSVRGERLGVQSAQVGNQTKDTKLIHGVVLLKSPIQEWMVKNVFDWNTSYFAELDKNKPLLYQCPEISKDINKLSGTDQAIFWRILNQYFSESNKRDNGEGAMSQTTKNLSSIDNLKSPLNNDELAKIDTFIDENIDEISQLSFEYFENIRLFQPKITNFEQYLSELTVNEKTRAWTYLFATSKKKRKPRKQSSTNIEPKYTSEVEKPKGKSVATIVIVITISTVLLLSFLLITRNKDDEKPSEKQLELHRMLVSQESVKKLLKDSDSAKFRNNKGLCGEVNSKNSFGAYSGFKRYIATPDLTIIEGESPQVDQTTFNEVWSKVCK